MSMSDQEIQFGEIEQTRRQTRLRPDRSQQWAVVVCGEPRPDDVPIFVDLDAMREMEDHAQSDCRVELGGVLLGGQFDDETGQPYVLVQDSLRARHYESSRGSFKFTHDTWSDISRRRDQFSSDLQMVGWYHTHPDWGVFLSGMDTFICEHFFNRPLDVALVLDPCRGELGWFQWADQPERQVRETAGFYLIASRHRRRELERYAAQLEGKRAMTHDSRSHGTDLPMTAFPVTVASVPDPRGIWFAAGVMGVLTLQLLVVLLIVWKLLFSPTETLPGGAAGQPSAVLEPVLADAEYRETQFAWERVESQRQLLDRVIAAFDDGMPENLVSLLENQGREIEHLQADMRAYRVLEQHLRDENRTLVAKLDEASQLETQLRNQVRTLDRALAEARSEATEALRRLAALQDDPTPQTPATVTASPGSGQPSVRAIPWWMWIGGAALILIVVATAHALVKRGSQPTTPLPTAEGENSASMTSLIDQQEK
jgi:proteasome lid subunit RPN8/RPN11